MNNPIQPQNSPNLHEQTFDRQIPTQILENVDPKFKSSIKKRPLTETKDTRLLKHFPPFQSDIKKAGETLSTFSNISLHNEGVESLANQKFKTIQTVASSTIVNNITTSFPLKFGGILTTVSLKEAEELILEGLAQLEQKDYEAALISFCRALQLDSNNALALKKRAIIYTYQKKYNLAIQDLSHILKIVPNSSSDILLLRSAAYTANREYDLAWLDCYTILEKNPTHVKALEGCTILKKYCSPLFKMLFFAEQ